MLPDIRAVIAAIITAVGLLMISFGLVATFRVAQDNRSGSLQADLAQRGRSPAPVTTGPRTTLIIDTPDPPRAAENLPPAEPSSAPVAEISEAPAIPPPAEAAAALSIAPPPAAPAIGGPLPEHTGSLRTEAPPRDAAPTRAEKAAASKERAARLARERKAAARRAAQAQRAKATPPATFGTVFGQQR